MKKLIAVYVVLIIAVILLAVTRAGGNILPFSPFKGGASAEIGKNNINLIVAKSDKDRIKGLSGRKSLPQDQGMLFIFEQKGKPPFWMKDTQFALDIIYIDDTVVVQIFESVQAPKDGFIPRVEPTKDANRVLELNAGQAKKLGIKEGTKINFKGI